MATEDVAKETGLKLFSMAAPTSLSPNFCELPDSNPVTLCSDWWITMESNQLTAAAPRTESTPFPAPKNNFIPHLRPPATALHQISY
jgi:hypothetical protein